VKIASCCAVAATVLPLKNHENNLFSGNNKSNHSKVGWSRFYGPYLGLFRIFSSQKELSKATATLQVGNNDDVNI